MSSLYLHDATYTSLIVINESLASGGSTNDGRLFFDISRNLTFEGTFVSNNHTYENDEALFDLLN